MELWDDYPIVESSQLKEEKLMIPKPPPKELKPNIPSLNIHGSR